MRVVVFWLVDGIEISAIFCTLTQTDFMFLKFNLTKRTTFVFIFSISQFSSPHFKPLDFFAAQTGAAIDVPDFNPH